MKILYTSDGEEDTLADLDTLIANLTRTGGWYQGCNEHDMRDELSSRGWYDGWHEFGHYLVLNLEKLNLEYRKPKP